MKSKSIKAALFLFASGIVFTAVMGFAHTKAGRPLLAYLGLHLGKKEFCPLGYDRPSTRYDQKRIRKMFAATHVGKPAAISLDALSFKLENTTRTQILAWAISQHGECHEMRHSNFESECVGPFFNSETTTLWLAFDDAEKLISARGVEKFSSPVNAWDFYQRLRSNLRKQAGHSAVEAGVREPNGLAPLLAQASVEAEFRNYSATARVGNMGKSFVTTHDFESF